MCAPKGIALLYEAKMCWDNLVANILRLHLFQLSTFPCGWTCVQSQVMVILLNQIRHQWLYIAAQIQNNRGFFFVIFFTIFDYLLPCILLHFFVSFYFIRRYFLFSNEDQVPSNRRISFYFITSWLRRINGSRSSVNGSKLRMWGMKWQNLWQKKNRVKCDPAIWSTTWDARCICTQTVTSQ